MGINTKPSSGIPQQSITGVHVGPLSGVQLTNLAGDGINTQFPTIIELRTRNNGLKKRWFWHRGNDECPIKSIKFGSNIVNGGGAGNVDFSIVDFPIDINDTLIVTYNGTKIYSGYVDSLPDPSGGVVKLSPPITKLKRVLYSSSGWTSSQNVNTLIQTLIDHANSTNNTNITYHSSLNEISDSETITFDEDYSYENIYKILDDLIGRFDGYYWGITFEDQFYVKQKESDRTDVYYNNSTPQFSKVTYLEDWTKVKATREIVKDSDTGSALVGTGYGLDPVASAGTWATLTDVENKVGTLERVVSVKNNVSAAELGEWSYTRLLNETSSVINIKLSGINLDVKEPRLFQKIYIHSEQKDSLVTIDDLDDLTKLSSERSDTLNTNDFFTGNGSISLDVGGVLPTDWIYDLGELYVTENARKVGFMIKAESSLNVFQVSVGRYTEDEELESDEAWGEGSWGGGAWGEGDGTITSNNVLWDTVYDIEIDNSGWNWIEFPVTESFRYFGIRQKNATTGEVLINRLQVYDDVTHDYEGNIVSLEYVLDKHGLNADGELNNFEKLYNDKLFEIESRLKALEVI